MSRRPSAAVSVDPELLRVAALARWMDRRYLDALLGFVLPAVGDLLGALVGLYIVRIAARRGAPRPVLARMLLNLALDTVVGALPLVGDVLDVYSRPNEKNVRFLMQRWAEGRVRDPSHHWLLMAGAIAIFLVALSVPIVMGTTILLLLDL